jgi:hypothetical protein
MTNRASCELSVKEKKRKGEQGFLSLKHRVRDIDAYRCCRFF